MLTLYPLFISPLLPLLLSLLFHIRFRRLKRLKLASIALLQHGWQPVTIAIFQKATIPPEMYLISVQLLSIPLKPPKALQAWLRVEKGGHPSSNWPEPP